MLLPQLSWGAQLFYAPFKTVTPHHHTLSVSHPHNPAQSQILVIVWGTHWAHNDFDGGGWMIHPFSQPPSQKTSQGRTSQWNWKCVCYCGSIWTKTGRWMYKSYIWVRWKYVRCVRLIKKEGKLRILRGLHVNIRIRPSLGIQRWLCRQGHAGLSLISWLEFTQHWSQLIEEHWGSHVTGPPPPKGVLSAPLALSLFLRVTETLYFSDVFVCIFVDRTPALILETCRSA